MPLTVAEEVHALTATFADGPAAPPPYSGGPPDYVADYKGCVQLEQFSLACTAYRNPKTGLFARSPARQLLRRTNQLLEDAVEARRNGTMTDAEFHSFTSAVRSSTELKDASRTFLGSESRAAEMPWTRKAWPSLPNFTLLWSEWFSLVGSCRMEIYGH